MLRHLRLRPLLGVLVLASVVPLGVFAAFLIRASWQQQRALVDQQNVETAHAISLAVDQHVDSAISALRVLASLADGHDDPQVLREAAARAVRERPGWRAILLLDSSGRLLMDTASRTTTSDGVAHSWLNAVLSTRAPAVSDLINDGTRHFVVVAVPIVRNDTTAGALGAEIDAAALSALLRRQEPPPNGVVTLLDRQRKIMARTRGEDVYVGGPPSSGFVDASLRMSEGSWREMLLEGTPAYAALSRSSTTGWTVGVGLPAEPIDAAIRQSYWRLGGAGALVLVFGVTSVWLLSSILARGLDSAAAAARALARGESQGVPASPVVELDELSSGLREAALILAAREEARADAAQARAIALEERERALAAEQAARREAEAVSQEKDAFVATICHELRTPLNAVLGWVHLLRHETLGADDQRHAVEVIERNTRVQAQLIEDLLDMARIVRGQVHIELLPVRLARVVEAAIDAVRPTSVEKGLEVTLVSSIGDAMVAGDARRLEQVVWNLLNNSIKFTPPGGRIVVTLARKDADTATICVQDTGVGIGRQFLPFVFDRFKQGHDARWQEGTGLGIGLALVRHLVDLHGGSVVAESDGEGRGAVVTVALPLRRAAAAVGKASTPPTADRDPAARLDRPALEHLRVLVVDDDADARDLAATVLQRAGAQVTTASSARLALELMRAAVPDVLISDIGMPHSTGYDLLATIRATPELRGVAAVALTAFQRYEDREAALAAGFDRHLGKPFDPAELVRVVAAVSRQPRA